MKNLQSKILAVVALAVGFTIGSVFPIFKSSPPAPIVKADTTWHAAMLQRVHDTLVIIQTYDTLPYPPKEEGEWAALDMGWTIGGMEMFANGKTKDTIQKHSIIYK